eukprot:EG_transcript_1925
MYSPFSFQKSRGSVRDWEEAVSPDVRLRRSGIAPALKARATEFQLELDLGATRKKEKPLVRGNGVPRHPRFGFDQLHFRPLGALPGQPALSPAQLKAYFVDWMYSYITEAQDFDSRYVWADCIHRQQRLATAALPPTNLLSVAIACTLAESLVPCFGSLQEPLRLVLRELFSAVYADYSVDTQVALEVVDPDRLLPPFPAVQRGCARLGREEAAPGQRCVMDFTLYADLAVTYAEELRTLQGTPLEGEAALQRAASRLRAGTAFYGSLVKRIAFRAWRNHVISRGPLERWGAIREQARQRHLRRRCFAAWRSHAALAAYDAQAARNDRQRAALAGALEAEAHRLGAAVDEARRRIAAYEMRLMEREQQQRRRDRYEEYLRWREETARLEERADSLRDQTAMLRAQAEKDARSYAAAHRVFRAFQSLGHAVVLRLADRGCPRAVGTRPSPDALLLAFEAAQAPRQRSAPPVPSPPPPTEVRPRPGAAAVDGEALLLFWLNRAVGRSEGWSPLPSPATNFSIDLRDSVHLTLLLHQLWPGSCSPAALRGLDLLPRARLVIDAAKSLGLSVATAAQDIVHGHAAMTLWLCHQLFGHWLDTHRGDPVSLVEEAVRIDPSEPFPEDAMADRYDAAYHAAHDEATFWATIGTQVQGRACARLLTDGGPPALPPVPDGDSALYAIIHTDHVAELLPKRRKDWGPVLDRLRLLLEWHYPVLRPIFEYYSTMSPLTTGLGLEEWAQFVADCRLAEGQPIPPADPPPDVALKLASCGLSAEAGVSPTTFCEGLLWLADQQYAGRKQTLDQKLEALLREHVQPHASTSHTAALRHLLAEPRLHAVLRRHEKALIQVFDFYGSGMDVNARNVAAISVAQFLTLCADCRWLDTSFTRVDVARIFGCLRDWNQKRDELGFDDFPTAIATVAFSRQNNPFVSEVSRLTRFFSDDLLKPLRAAHPSLALP